MKQKRLSTSIADTYRANGRGDGVLAIVDKGTPTPFAKEGAHEFPLLAGAVLVRGLPSARRAVLITISLTFLS